MWNKSESWPLYNRNQPQYYIWNGNIRGERRRRRERTPLLVRQGGPVLVVTGVPQIWLLLGSNSTNRIKLFWLLDVLF